MAVCNLFNKLTKETGNFMLFSQYTEDLSKVNTHPGRYRITPSRFIVLDIDYNRFKPFENIEDSPNNNIKDPNISSGDKNLDVPTYFQNYFENGCAFLRQEMKDKWNPGYSRNLFWNSLFETNLLDIENEEKICKSIKYIGDINIHTYDEYLGMGYSEVYCSIPADSKCMDVKYSTGDYLYYSEYPDDVVLGYKKDEYDDKSIMCPLEIIDKNDNIDDGHPKNIKYFYNPIFNITPVSENQNTNNEGISFRNDKEYNFNTIIILYDMMTLDDENNVNIIYSNIPMGVHICGLINNEGTTSNRGTKIVSNDDIFGMGTSYGLRICSRFITTPNQDNIKNVDIQTDSDSSYAATNMVLSKLSESIEKMNQISEQCVKNTQMNKEFLSAFKNYRTNVPYIRQIGDRFYWFINGRNTYVEAMMTELNLDLISEDNIDILFPKMREKMNDLFEQMRLNAALGYR